MCVFFFLQRDVTVIRTQIATCSRPPMGVQTICVPHVPCGGRTSPHSDQKRRRRVRLLFLQRDVTVIRTQIATCSRPPMGVQTICVPHVPCGGRTSPHSDQKKKTPCASSFFAAGCYALFCARGGLAAGASPRPTVCTQFPLFCRGDSRIARFCRSGDGRFGSRPCKVCAPSEPYTQKRRRMPPFFAFIPLPLWCSGR